MTERNTLIRSCHDLGLAAWFGGTLMGAVGVNGAAAGAKDPAERLTLSSLGWGKWAPVQIGAIAAHAIGGVGLIRANRGRLAVQPEGRTNTRIKLALTLIAVGSTIYSGVVGKKSPGMPTRGQPVPPNRDALPPKCWPPRKHSRKSCSGSPLP